MEPLTLMVPIRLSPPRCLRLLNWGGPHCTLLYLFFVICQFSSLFISISNWHPEMMKMKINQINSSQSASPVEAILTYCYCNHLINARQPDNVHCDMKLTQPNINLMLEGLTKNLFCFTKNLLH